MVRCNKILRTYSFTGKILFLRNEIQQKHLHVPSGKENTVLCKTTCLRATHRQIKNSNISSQTLNGIYKQSNKTLKINSTLLKNSLINPWKPSNSLPLLSTPGMQQLTFLFVVIFGKWNKWNKDDDNTYHILITNRLTASAKTVIPNYLLRWGIEHCFKEFKCAINSLLEFSSTSELSKNKELADRYFKIKSNRLKKKLVA